MGICAYCPQGYTLLERKQTQPDTVGARGGVGDMRPERAAGLAARVGENKKDDFLKTNSEKSQKTKKRFNYGILGTISIDTLGCVWYCIVKKTKRRMGIMKVGYVRVSTEEQNTIRQENLMKELGVEKVYIEKASGKSRVGRPQLAAMLDYVREGDVVIVESISRFARSTKDLLSLVEQLKSKKVAFVSQKENIDTETPQGQFVLTVFGAMAQLERDQTMQRQAEGIAAAKAAGKYKGRKPIAIDDDLLKDVHTAWYKNEITTAHAIKRLGVSRNTFYRRMWEYEDDMGIPRKNGSNA